MLAKLFQEFHPIGAAPKHAVADTRSSQEDRTGTTYHLDGVKLCAIHRSRRFVMLRVVHDCGTTVKGDRSGNPTGWPAPNAFSRSALALKAAMDIPVTNACYAPTYLSEFNPRLICRHPLIDRAGMLDHDSAKLEGLKPTAAARLLSHSRT